MPQDRQRPRRTRNDSTGILSCHAIAVPHPGHAERGRQRLRLGGTRAITTFKKLPIASPKSTTAASVKTGVVWARVWSIASPGLDDRWPETRRQLGVQHAEDPPRGARGARASRLEGHTGKPGPGVRRVVLQRDRLAEEAQRLVPLPEFGVCVAHVDVRPGVAGIDLYRVLQGLERLMGAPVAQKSGAQVVERVDVVRVPLEIEPEMLDGAGKVTERRMRAPEVHMDLLVV